MTVTGIISALFEKPHSSANRDDGYFGWTDRFGMRAEPDEPGGVPGERRRAHSISTR